MMTTKAMPRTPQKAREPAADDLKTAYEIHTLVQLITARLAGGPYATSALH